MLTMLEDNPTSNSSTRVEYRTDSIKMNFGSKK
jgi:hypothetical protein